jgi:uncharacterized protein with NAD-binding domain and iron-sulfur cluster
VSRRKIAILGGGASSLFAAWDLVHSDPDAYDITVYQVGWRLGGKGASGRRSTADKRIEEHGLHLMFGFYENVFRVVRQAYEEAYRDPTLWQRFFRGEDTAVSMIHYLDAANAEWESWKVPYRTQRTTGLPGDPDDRGDAHGSELLTILRNAASWLGGLAQQQADIANPRSPPSMARDANTPQTLDTLRAEIDTLKAFTPSDLGKEPLYWTIARRFLKLLAPHVSDAKNADRDRERFEKLLRYGGDVIDTVWRDAANSGLLEIVRFVKAVMRGLFRDLFLHGLSNWFELDRYDLRAWIHRHGADPSPIVDALYDAVFATYSELGAGSILQAAMKAAFLSKGSVIYKMQAGMGDTIFTPLYLALRARKVKFRFFHRVESLTSEDARLVDSIVLERQVAVDDDYDPLVDVDIDLGGGRRRVQCWPSEPIWDRLPEDERDRIRKGQIDLENYWTPPADPERRITLQRDKDFDDVILGISVAALPALCADLLAQDPPFADHVIRLARSTTATQAMQLWTVPGREPQQPNPLIVPNTEPYDTIADMSHLVAAENHPSGAVGGIHYLCSALREWSPPPPRSARGYPDKLSGEAFENGRTWVTDRAPILWRNLANDGGFDWSALYDPSGGEGPARFEAQFVHTPRNLSDRYVIPVPMSHEARLMSNGTRYRNLYITGDWIKTSLSIGCLEAAAMAGIQAARALSKEADNVWVARARGDWIEDVIARSDIHVGGPTPPRYRHRDGELLIPPPYQLRCDGLILFVLRADPRQLQAVCDNDLNLGPTKYRPYGDFVVLYGTTLAHLTIGTAGEAREGGFWLPVVSDSDSTVRIYSPYVWIDSATSTIVGRAVYGYTKQTGEVQVPTAGNPASLVVTGDALVTGDTGKLLQRTPLFTASRAQPTAWAPPQQQDVSSWLDLARRVALEVGRAPSEVTEILGGMRSIFLKQLPDVKGAAAVYQAIVEARIVPKLDTISGRVLDEAWTVTIPAHDEPRLVERLGLAATMSFQHGMRRIATISPILQLWMQFEGSIEPGTITWSATASGVPATSDGGSL